MILKWITRIFIIAVLALAIKTSPALYNIGRNAIWQLEAKKYVHSVFQLRNSFQLGSGGGGTGFLVEYRNKRFLVSAGHVCKKAVLLRTFSDEGTMLLVSNDYRIKRTVSPIIVDFISDLCLLDVPSDGSFMHYSIPLKLSPVPPKNHTIFSVVGFGGLEDISLYKGEFFNMITVLFPVPKKLKSYLSVNLQCERQRRRFDLFMSNDSSGGWGFQPMFQCYTEIPAYASRTFIIPGHSGSPTLDEDGRVVGVAVAGFVGQNYMLSVAWERLKSLLDNVLKSKNLNTLERVHNKCTTKSCKITTKYSE